MGDNNYGNMKSAEWRGKIGAKIDGIEKDIGEIKEQVTGINGKVNTNTVEVEKLKAVSQDNKLSWKSRATIIAAAIMAVSAVIVALVN